MAASSNTLSLESLAFEARRLSQRLRQHDSSADGVLASAHGALAKIEALKEFNDDVEALAR